MLEHTRFAVGHSQSVDEYSGTEPVIDFRTVLGVLRRSAVLIGAFLAVSIVTAIGYLYFTPPTYRAHSNILLDAPRVEPFQQESVFSGASYNVSEVESQAQLIKSDYLITKLVRELGLAEDRRIVAPRPSAQRQMLSALGSFLGNLQIAKPVLSWMEDEAPRNDPTQVAIERIRDSLDIRRIGVTYVLEVEVIWDSPETAAFIANALADTYIADRLERRRTEAERASAWFNGRIAELKQRAIDAEQVIQTFRTENQIVDPGRQGLLIDQQIGDIRSSLVAASAATEEARTRLAEVREITSLDPLNSSVDNVSANALIPRLRSDYVALALQESQALRQYGADHEVTKNLRDRMMDIERSLREELRQLEAIYEREYQSAQANEEALREQLKTMMTEAAQVGASQVRLRALESEAGVYRSLYDNYLQLYLQTQQQQTFPNAEARIISEATPPENRVAPSASLTLGLAVAIGGGLGLAVAFLRETTDRSVRTSAQLQRITGAPTLGIVPAQARSASQPMRQRSPKSPVESVTVPAGARLQHLRISDPRLSVVLDDPYSLAAETIRRVKIQIDAVPRGQTASVGFVSGDPGEGRGIVAANYAQLLASGGRRTLLIDADLRTLALSRMLTPRSKAGLVDIAAGDPGTAIEAAVWTDHRSGMQFLPGRAIEEPASSSPIALNPDRLILSLSHLAKSYDQLVLDLPALSEAADAAALEKFLDGFILVAAWGTTKADALSKVLTTSRINPEKLLGTVLDNVDLTRFGTYEKLN